MKTIYYTLIALLSLPAFGQIQQDINKTTGTVSNPISDIDSIRFNGSVTDMEVVLNNGNIESHTISDIDNVTFDTIYSLGTVHCDPTNPTEIVDVTNPVTGKTWMDRNLGASQAATSSSDVDSYGDLYQWGRFADGHQCRTSSLHDSDTDGLATTAVPNDGNAWDGDFIINNVIPFDWLQTEDVNLWQGVNGTNNPCPNGYRVPTDAELEAERLSWVDPQIGGTNDAAGAFSSPLKLPMAGFRNYSPGSVLGGGNTGRYWSSNVSSPESRYLNFFGNDSNTTTSFKAMGLSVRCIKD